jgi:hypothetical protein
MLALRASRGLSAPTVDALYRSAAQRGVDAYLKASKPSSDVAMTAAQDFMRAESRRVRAPRPAGPVCTLFVELAELEQLDMIAGLLAPSLTKLGVGSEVHTDDKGTRLATMLILEGVPCNENAR